jgi:hypothetical protein
MKKLIWLALLLPLTAQAGKDNVRPIVRDAAGVLVGQVERIEGGNYFVGAIIGGSRLGTWVTTDGHFTGPELYVDNCVAPNFAGAVDRQFEDTGRLTRWAAEGPDAMLILASVNNGQDTGQFNGIVDGAGNCTLLADPIVFGVFEYILWIRTTGTFDVLHIGFLEPFTFGNN